MVDVEKLVKKYGIDRKANVIGYSMKLQKKIVSGRETDTLCIRIYVEEKLPAEALRAEDVIPREVEGIPTDVVEIGRVKALSLDKTSIFRPLIFGVSVGHYDITAGTLGIPVEKDGETLLASNAHVLTPDPSKHPREIVERRICQPGPYDISRNNLGSKDDYVVGEYVWHQQVYPELGESGCTVAKAVSHAYNFLAKVFGAKTRLRPVVEEENIIDFAVFRPSIKWEFRYPMMDVGDKYFVGLLFAGSNMYSIICKAKHIEKLGYKPLIESSDVSEGDVVEKDGRTTCHTSGKVLDSSAAVRVSYGSFNAVFRDVIVSDMKSAGGDSGSFVGVSTTAPSR
ncbi:MAG: hypothetical protein QXM02_06870 [Thermoproteota archaeon]